MKMSLDWHQNDQTPPLGTNGLITLGGKRILHATYDKGIVGERLWRVHGQPLSYEHEEVFAWAALAEVPKDFFPNHVVPH